MPDNSTCLNYPTRAEESVYLRNSPRLAARIFTLLGLLTMTCTAPGIRAQGLYRDGVGARSVSLGGADVAYAIDPLGAMTSNPAGLALLSVPQVDADLGFLSASGDFINASNPNATLHDATGFVPDLAFATPLKGHGIGIGFSIVPDTALAGTWNYVDPPGGVGGTSYGAQQIKSEIIAVRAAVGLGVALNKVVS